MDTLRMHAPPARRLGIPFRHAPEFCSYNRSGKNVVALDLVDQRCTRNAELDRGACAVACVMLERPLDVLALEIFQAERCMAAVSDSRTGPELTGKMLHTHCRLPSAENECALEHI